MFVFSSLAILFVMQRRNHELASLLEQHSTMNSTLMNQIEDLVRFLNFMHIILLQTFLI